MPSNKEAKTILLYEVPNNTDIFSNEYATQCPSLGSFGVIIEQSVCK